jgi:hypothetical protein
MPPEWVTKLPGFRVRAELEEARRQLSEAREERKALRAELDEGRKRLRAAKADLKLATAALETAGASRDLTSGTLAGMAAVLESGRSPIAVRLDDVLASKADTYRSATPFPHVVIDGFVDDLVLRTVVEEFSSADRRRWHHTEAQYERKSSTENEEPLGPFARTLIHVLNAGPFVSFLEKLTGIEGLIADPHLRGGGFHEIRRGGKLGVHADFNFYKRLGVYRRLNLIVYLNADWRDEWGGHLELWEKGAAQPAERIAPIFNRAVIFDTSNSSYHGHPHPLQCPEDRSRQSLALYYYTVDYPYEDDREAHTTIFIDTPEAPAAS